MAAEAELRGADGLVDVRLSNDRDFLSIENNSRFDLKLLIELDDRLIKFNIGSSRMRRCQFSCPWSDIWIENTPLNLEDISLDVKSPAIILDHDDVTLAGLDPLAYGLDSIVAMSNGTRNTVHFINKAKCDVRIMVNLDIKQVRVMVKALSVRTCKFECEIDKIKVDGIFIKGSIVCMDLRSKCVEIIGDSPTTTINRPTTQPKPPYTIDFRKALTGSTTEEVGPKLELTRESFIIQLNQLTDLSSKLGYKFKFYAQDEDGNHVASNIF